MSSVNHENPSNVLAALEESQTAGRYVLRDKDTAHAVSGNLHVRDIDIFFTYNETLLENAEVPPAYSTQEQAVIDLSPIFWIDLNKPVELQP